METGKAVRVVGLTRTAIRFRPGGAAFCGNEAFSLLFRREKRETGGFEPIGCFLKGGAWI